MRPLRLSGVSFLGLLALGALLPGCSTGVLLSHEDPHVSTAPYKTYQWIGQSEAIQLDLQNPRIDYLSGWTNVVRRPQVEEELRTLTEQRLAQDGYRPVSTGEPDFYVTYFGKAKDDDWVSSWWGTTPTVNNVPVVIFPDFEQRYAYKYKEGTIYLVIFDAKSKKPAWSGGISSTEFGSDLKGPAVASALDRLVDGFHSSA